MLIRIPVEAQHFDWFFVHMHQFSETINKEREEE